MARTTIAFKILNQMIDTIKIQRMSGQGQKIFSMTANKNFVTRTHKKIKLTINKLKINQHTCRKKRKSMLDHSNFLLFTRNIIGVIINS